MDYFEYQSYYPSPKPKKRCNNSFLAGFFGALIGAITVLVAYPFLVEQGWVRVPHVGTHTNENPDYQPNVQTPITTQKVSLDVETDVTKAVDKVLDAVVGISNFQGWGFWTEPSEVGTGSGVLYKKQGNYAYIVTNQHVVDGADRIEVTLHDGTKLEARLLGEDLWTDLAVLRVDGRRIKRVAEFGDSDSLKLGEPVLAIGNPLGIEFAGSITQGIISGLERTVPVDFNGDGYPDWNAEVLQTDAAINPGNSGGALVNIAGQVIGINSMKIAQEEVEGIGFSIPINIAIPIIQDLETAGEVRRPYMGVSMQDLSNYSFYIKDELKLPDEVTSGVIVVEVVEGSPAYEAGLRKNDVITKLDGTEITSIIDLRKYLYKEKEIGDALKVSFYRNGKYMSVVLTLGEDSV